MLIGEGYRTAAWGKTSRVVGCGRGWKHRSCCAPPLDPTCAIFISSRNNQKTALYVRWL